MTFLVNHTFCSNLYLAGAFAFALSCSASSIAQTFNPPIPGGGTPIQRGLGEALRGGAQGGTIGDSLRRGVDEATRSAIETPNQTSQRDQQLQLRQQIEAQQRFQGEQTAPPYGTQPYGTQQYGTGTRYRDDSGRVYYFNERGNRVYTLQQSQEKSFSNAPGSTTQTVTPQGPSLGVSIEPVDRGLRVLSVRSGSAAEQAQIEPGDVIRSVNGQPITSVQLLVQSVHDSAGDQMDIQIERGGRQQQVVAMIVDSNSNYRRAKPVIGDEADSAALVDQIASLRIQIANLQNEVAELRDKVASNASINENTELLNNAPRTLNDNGGEDN